MDTQPMQLFLLLPTTTNCLKEHSTLGGSAPSRPQPLMHLVASITRSTLSKVITYLPVLNPVHISVLEPFDLFRAYETVDGSLLETLLPSF